MMKRFRQLLTALALGLVIISLTQPRVAYAHGPTPVGPEFRVNTYTANDQARPGVAMDADGDFVVTWDSLGQDGSGSGVYAQPYKSDGPPIIGTLYVQQWALRKLSGGD
jgi:hypothetical protein